MINIGVLRVRHVKSISNIFNDFRGSIKGMKCHLLKGIFIPQT